MTQIEENWAKRFTFRIRACRETAIKAAWCSLVAIFLSSSCNFVLVKPLATPRLIYRKTIHLIKILVATVNLSVDDEQTMFSSWEVQWNMRIFYHGTNEMFVSSRFVCHLSEVNVIRTLPINLNVLFFKSSNSRKQLKILNATIKQSIQDTEHGITITIRIYQFPIPAIRHPSSGLKTDSTPSIYEIAFI